MKSHRIIFTSLDIKKLLNNDMSAYLRITNTNLHRCYSCNLTLYGPINKMKTTLFCVPNLEPWRNQGTSDKGSSESIVGEMVG